MLRLDYATPDANPRKRPLSHESAVASLNMAMLLISILMMSHVQGMAHDTELVFYMKVGIALLVVQSLVALISWIAFPATRYLACSSLLMAACNLFYATHR